ncbi:MAG: anthranilate synthase component I, partial [Planctomycetes bacterium]|nr:anthranilate synthase component I [Planctomycetota bacterium]
GVGVSRLYLYPDSRIEAARWIRDNVPEGSAIGIERGGFSMRSLIDPKRYDTRILNTSVLFEARGRCVTIRSARDDSTRTEEADDPLALLQAELERHDRARLPNLPRFVGGAVGYAAYDTVRYYEHLPNGPHDDRGLPELLFGIYESMVVFDHVHKTVLVVVHSDPRQRDPRQAYRAACGQIDAIIERLSRPLTMKPVRINLPAQPIDRWTSNFERPRFEQAVDACKEYIRAGDIFQVVISQRLRVETPADPFDIYRALRVVNPSPFMFYLKSPETILVGSSPEILCRVEDGVVTNRPLAGTRRRGNTEAEDRALRDELLADPKERAEHVMLVDLGRNDVGRVAEPGSVRLSEIMSVEYYSHVMHICSNVTGRLAAGKTAFDALRAALPVGTVSGAPKVRAMQIIDEFEPTRRGPYAGAVGYIDFAGNMDTCIALRTMVVAPRAGSTCRLDIQVGAGIVADSIAAQEYDETLNKAAGMLAAIRVAEEQFPPMDNGSP